MLESLESTWRGVLYLLVGASMRGSQGRLGRRNGQPAVECFGGIRRRKRYMLRVSEI
jgi:hypothetical protein